MGPSELPPPPSRPDPAGSAAPAVRAPAPTRRRAIWIGVGVALALIAAATTIGLVAGGAGDGFPDRLDGLERIRSAEADRFEESLDEFDLGDIRIVGAMYGTDDRALLLIERIEGPEDQVTFVPLAATFDGFVVGFEGSGAGDIDQDGSVTDQRAGFEVICAGVEVVANPVMPSGDATICAWKGQLIGVVFDFRTANLAGAMDTTARIAARLDEV